MAKPTSGKRWVRKVQETSNAMDLPPGRNLDRTDRARLQAAKDELRRLFGRGERRKAA
jgi:hypothetical protein